MSTRRGGWISDFRVNKETLVFGLRVFTLIWMPLQSKRISNYLGDFHDALTAACGAQINRCAKHVDKQCKDQITLALLQKNRVEWAAILAFHAPAH
jgi:hypothetical protein